LFFEGVEGTEGEDEDLVSGEGPVMSDALDLVVDDFADLGREIESLTCKDALLSADFSVHWTIDSAVTTGAM